VSGKRFVPQDPAIYHITHVDNLAGILSEGGLRSDAERIARSLVSTNIGHRHIKQRRLARVVTTSANGTLGEYVPFNFCPRSVMLFAVSRGHPDYSGGQEDIVHLISTVSRATALGTPWAFTDRHAELQHALHFDSLGQLGEVPWEVMDERYWTGVKEERQAEFLVKNFVPVPWSAISGIGVAGSVLEARVRKIISGEKQ
jgi:hypothetical protein